MSDAFPRDIRRMARSVVGGYGGSGIVEDVGPTDHPSATGHVRVTARDGYGNEVTAEWPAANWWAAMRIELQELSRLDAMALQGGLAMSDDAPDLIVTRHRGAVEWLARHLFAAEHPAWDRSSPPKRWLEWETLGEESPVVYRSVPVRESVTADDVCGKHVVGNLPLHLAALCRSVTVIEFGGPPPRGGDYTAADMEAAGARLRTYSVTEIVAVHA